MSSEVVAANESVPKPAGWQRLKRVRRVPQHNWQVELPPERSSGEQWRRFRFFSLLGVLVVLMGAFVLVAVDAPRKTPMLIVTDVRPGSIPQSPWLDEEIERLKLLDQTTLTIRTCTPASSVGAAFTQFHQALQDLAAAANQTGAVVVYVRLPGLVDDAGRPCLIPSHATLVRTEEWLPVEALLDHVAGDIFPAHVRRLVIFDRSQSARVWPAGVLADTFADQLASLMKRQHDAGHWQSLAVLTDTSDRQNGWHAATTGGSVFGEAVWSALAGRADAIGAGGNGDQRITLSEFANFVTRRTTDWVQANRQQAQTPTLISSTSGDVNLFWAASSRTQHAWQAKADRLRTTINRDSSIERMTKLWNERLALEQQAPWRFDPVGWQRLNRSMLNYERLISGGNGAARQRSDVERSIQSLLVQLSESTRCRLPLNPGEARLHHRHLTQRVNSGQPAESERIANVFSQVRERPARQLAKSLLTDLHRSGPVRQDWDLVVLHHLINDAPDAAWAQSEVMSRTLALLEALGGLQALSEVTVSGMLDEQCQSVEADAREILDRLFVGTDHDLLFARDRLSAAEDKVAACRQFAQQLIQALDQRDRAAAELPRLAEWIYAPHHGETEEIAHQRIGEWFAATKSWKHLEQAIENCHEQGGSTELVSMVSTLSTQLERELAVLWARVDRAYDRLLTDPVDAVAVAEMEHMLSTSLLPRQPDSRSRSRVEQRICLYETWQQAAIQLDMQHAVALRSGNHKPEAVKAVVADDWMIQIVRGAAPHPMSLMLALGDHTVDLAAPSSPALGDELLTKADERTASIRRHLACIPQILLRDRLTSFDSPELRDRAWQTQARQLRDAAPWLSGDLPYNPCQRMELAAWGGHLRRRAACMAEDFWFGPLDSDVPFFVRAATDLLDAADLCEAGFASSLTAAGKAETNALRQRLASQRPPLRVTAIAIPQVLPADDLQTNVSVTRSPEARLPTGTAAVLISQQNRSTETTVPRAAAAVPAESPVVQEPTTSWVTLRCPAPTTNSDNSPPARALALFRGHRFVDTFELVPTAGLTVRSAPALPAPTTVVVQSHQRRPNAILFILDASASMTDNVAREGNRGSVRKLDAAMEALTSLLNDLADQSEVQVGVLIYGHRVASGDTAAAGIVRQPLYRQRFPFPSTLQPYEDVETVLPIGRFGVIERSQIEDRLRFVRPWGETPLYLSILQGLEQFESVRADVTKTMVVITDGLNYQFNPAPEKQTQLDDVLRSVPGRD
ncbi:MAG TPA: vWA domain-containing protein, partial [Planctomycetaceae bacterium]|nr:vWA domain-containing protein [Planctomycetaceae bacterium]